ncbi:UNVERIFIED_CONTAM: hypothetical protein K2H54_006372 [Gekko kuhli]
MKGRLGRRHHLHFLNALCGVCGAHGRGGRATLPFPKEAVALKVKEIMRDSFFSIEPKFLLAMRAVANSSLQFQPPTNGGLGSGAGPRWEPSRPRRGWRPGMRKTNRLIKSVANTPAAPVSSRRLRSSFGEGCIPRGRQEESQETGLWQEGEEGLHPMLLALRREDPSAGNFFTLLDGSSSTGRCRTPRRKSRLQQHQSRLPLPWGQNTAKEPPARSKASSPPGGRGAFREPVQSPLGFSGPLETVAVLLVDSTP